MRNQIERLVLLPSSLGCFSETSIATGGQFPNRSKRNMSPSPTRIQTDDKGEEKSADDNERLSDGSLKSLSSLLAVPKFQNLLKNIKNFPQLFVDKDEEVEEDDDGMNIGFPTDVKHVTHIGIDGTSTSILSRGSDNLKEPLLHASPPVHSTPSRLAVPQEADELNAMLPSENSHHEDRNAILTGNPCQELWSV